MDLNKWDRGWTGFTSPNKLIRTLGFRLAQMYTNEKAREEESHGSVKSGDTSCLHISLVRHVMTRHCSFRNDVRAEQ